ncbi:MAG: 30S ribosome-binding factor RbfA [Chitinophagales bacterium]|nr:30S ribosome-binding factor RbfA [Chitinophagales bacterium]
MDSRRQLKVASLIKEAFTEILTRDGKKIYGKAFVTVSNVNITSDLLLARFNLSIYNTEDADAVVQKFNEHKFELKRALSEKLRHHIRRIPEIEFYKDETMEYVFHMEDLFKRIKQEDETLKQQLETAKPKTLKSKSTTSRSKKTNTK